jgi:hypothetical protein
VRSAGHHANDPGRPRGKNNGAIIAILVTVAINLAILQLIWWWSPTLPGSTTRLRRKEEGLWLFGDPHKARRNAEIRRAQREAALEARKRETR